MHPLDDDTTMPLAVPAEWSADQAEAIKERFRRQRPAVARATARGLWRYWASHEPEVSLFGDPEMDLALVLHARAYGEMVPENADDDSAGDLPAARQVLASHAHLLEPLFPDPVPWGPGAALSSDAGAALASPVVDAAVTMVDRSPRSVLLVGTAPPAVQREIEAAAFEAALVVRCLETDFVNAGIIHVELPWSRQRPLVIPGNWLGGHPGAVSARAAKTAQEALENFVGTLRGIEATTGLVRVREIRAAAAEALADVCSTVAAACLDQERPAFWVPGDEPIPPRDVAIVAAYPRTLDPEQRFQPVGQRQGQILQLRLSRDLLRGRAFEALLDLYRFRRIERARADAEQRLAYSRASLAELEAEKAEFDGLYGPDDEMDVAAVHARYGETILLNQRIDDELLGAVTLAIPNEVDTVTYYTTFVPGHIERFEGWIAYLEVVLASLDEATVRDDAPVRRLATSRFLDAAVRSCSLEHDEQDLVEAYETWRQLVEPVLRLEWRAALSERGIAHTDVMTLHTFLHARLRSGPGGEQVVMTPLMVLDARHTAVLGDLDARVVRATDPADHVEPSPPAAVEPPWPAIEKLGQDPATSPDEFDARFLAALEAAPTGVLEGLFAALDLAPDEMRSAAATDQPPGSSAAVLERHLDRAMDELQVPRALARALSAYHGDALQTARACLRLPRLQGGPAARVALLLAVVECAAQGRDPRTLRAGQPGPDAHADNAIADARAADAAFTNGWLDKLDAMPAGKAPFSELFEGLPTLSSCPAALRSVMLARQAAETVRLARQVELGAARLRDDHESAEQVLAKLGPALDDLFLAEFSGGLRDEAVDLIEVLTGHQLR